MPGLIETARSSLVLVQGFVLLSAALPLVLLMSSDRVLSIDIGPTMRSVLQTVFEGVVVPPGMSFAVPACIWLLMLAVAESRRRVIGVSLPESAPSKTGE